MAPSLGDRSVTPRARPPGRNNHTTSPGECEASSGFSTLGEKKHGNANGSCLWNAGRRSEGYREVPISRRELLLLLGRVQAEVRSTAAAICRQGREGRRRARQWQAAGRRE